MLDHDDIVAQLDGREQPRDNRELLATVRVFDSVHVCLFSRRASSTTIDGMSFVKRFDHVGITVADLDAATDFFVALGLEVEGRTFVEGEFLETVTGLSQAHTEIVMLRPPDGGTALELSQFVRPYPEPGVPEAMANELGIRNVAFQVDNLDAALERVAGDGYETVGGVGDYEGVWRMAYVRGPEGIIVSLAQQVD